MALQDYVAPQFAVVPALAARCVNPVCPTQFASVTGSGAAGSLWSNGHDYVDLRSAVSKPMTIKTFASALQTARWRMSLYPRLDGSCLSVAAAWLRSGIGFLHIKPRNDPKMAQIKRVECSRARESHRCHQGVGDAETGGQTVHCQQL